MLVERAAFHQVPDRLPRPVDTEPAQVWRGVPVLAAVSAYRRKNGATARDGLETRVAAIHTQYHYAKSLGGRVLLHRPGFCVAAIHNCVSVGHNIIRYIFRRRKAASQQPAFPAEYHPVACRPDGSYVLSSRLRYRYAGQARLYALIHNHRHRNNYGLWSYLGALRNRGESGVPRH